MENKIAEHCFLDEAGDTTFYGKGERLLLGTKGVSQSFSMGMITIRGDLTGVRQNILELQRKIENDDFFNAVPSVLKKIKEGGFYFHATDDVPEVREKFFRFIKDLDCSAEIVVARKIPDLYSKKHNGRETEFYADVLSHLIKDKVLSEGKLVLNIAQRGNSTRNTNLQTALKKAISKTSQSPNADMACRSVIFNVQTPKKEPLLNVADYLCWSVQRIFERGEVRYYDYLKEKIRLVVDLYDFENLKNEYTPQKPLMAKNKLGPQTA